VLYKNRWPLLSHKFIIVCSYLLVNIFLLKAQTDSIPEMIFDVEEEETNIKDWLEILSANPVDINSASRETLEKIPFLSLTQIETIINFRPFFKKADVRRILGKEVYQFILPFIQLKKPAYFPKIDIRHRLQYTLNKKQGFIENIFLGSPYESYSRIRLKMQKNLSGGVLIQKDPGERNYTDHISGYISWQYPKHSLNLIVGNYYIHCAEGLLLSAPFSLPKSTFIFNPSFNKHLRVIPSLSSNESDGFLGGVVEWETGNGGNIVAYYSQKFKDAVLSDGEPGVTGFDRSGYHRTWIEVSKENTLLERSFGGIIKIPILFFRDVGLTYQRTTYDLPVVSSSPEDRRRKFYNFYGSALSNFSLFYSLRLKNINIGGEIVPLSSGGFAQQHTLYMGPPDWPFIFKWWHLPVSFHSPYGRSVSDSDPFPQSANGLMICTAGEPLKDLKIVTYWYTKKDLWRSYFKPLPTRIKGFFLQLEFLQMLKTRFQLRYNFTSSQDYQSDIFFYIKKKKYSIRLQIEKRFSTKVRFRSRWERVLINFSRVYATKKGLNFYQDLYWSIFKPINVQIRYSSFNTTDYDARMYEYENDLPGVFSNYSLFGSGNKWYFMLSAHFLKNTRIWFKYRQIFFDGIENIGTGLTSIAGEKRQDIHLQLEYKY
jgi:hypothetical protein